MRFAVLYPGQGSQKVGMGADLYKETTLGNELFNKVNTLVKRDVVNIFLNGPSEELNQTINTQISITAISVALTSILKDELKKRKLEFNPCCTCGHSLGEFTSLWFIDFFNFEDLIKLVSLRGSLMQNAPVGTMAAVLNLDENQIKKVISESKIDLTLANYNTPNQFVIAGTKDNIEKITDKIKLSGGKAIILPVGGAFHSPLMKESSIVFNKELDNIKSQNNLQLKLPIYQNVDGSPSTNPQTVLDKLKRQMTSSVLWTQTINNLVNDGVTAVVEIGPGKILTGLVKKINSTIECFNVSDLKTLNEFITLYESKLLPAKS